ncbi:PEP-CTERM sorting domain-containing protein [Scleromatobacter humisilvae]|uniref:Ice-binding protein C-terminal domain-containing protein n=1 Tax=Scleromatobacter humisilvae TaxID=2897159 RepID=A0A9X2C2J7_9BURK|nr:PEP-CTERM sorting domain-containing protein [Scleromatobacter humisilvae]MCK9686929.1 hypothetical protein [Scleromatobacter humisilvae]
MKQTSFAALSALALALAAGSADAQVANGSFAGLAGWSTAGDAASVATGGTHLVLTNAYSDGLDDADGINRNLSHNDPWPTDLGGGDLESFVGVPDGALDPDTANFVDAVEGSAALQTFTTAAGGTLSFQWDFATTQPGGDPSLSDQAFVVIDGKVITLASTLAATNVLAGGAYAADTGWARWSATLGAGAHTIAFGVADVGSASDTSALSVTGVSVSSVPEASSLAMWVAGLGLLAALQRRRRSHG